MGHNRAAAKKKKTLKRRRKEERRLVQKCIDRFNVTIDTLYVLPDDNGGILYLTEWFGGVKTYKLPYRMSYLEAIKYVQGGCNGKKD